MAKLICSKCGSKLFEPWSSSTLMIGPNKHTYTCAQCGNQEEVWDSGEAFQPMEVNLGPDEEAVK